MKIKVTLKDPDALIDCIDTAYEDFLTWLSEEKGATP